LLQGVYYPAKDDLTGCWIAVSFPQFFLGGDVLAVRRIMLIKRTEDVIDRVQ